MLLVALFALYARYNRKAQEMEMDADEVGFQIWQRTDVQHSCLCAECTLSLSVISICLSA